MTEKQKAQYQIRYDIESYRCTVCYPYKTCMATQQAHRISKSKTNYKIYGNNIIDHNINLVPTTAQCNSRFNIGNKPRMAQCLADLIESRGNELLTVNAINSIIEFEFKGCKK